MRVAVTGATGLIGRAISAHLRTLGHTVIPISRTPIEGGIQWDPDGGKLPASGFDGVDAVVHLAGENIAASRWTERRKQELRLSRTGPTSLLVRTLTKLTTPPTVLISASAVGIYGEHGDDIVDESTPPASDFLGELAVAWEAAASPARSAGIRLVHPRFATVLSPHGGALARLLPFFRLGLGGRLAGGQQWMHWVAIEDVVSALAFALADDTLEGPINVVAPGIVRNADFTAALARAVHRPAVFPIPRIALRIMFGELADAALLPSIRVVPTRLIDHGFAFSHGDLDLALGRQLGRRHP